MSAAPSVASSIVSPLPIHPPSSSLSQRFSATASKFPGAVPTPKVNDAVNILITGSSRGLGLELVRQYAAANSSSVVIAGARDVKSASLTELAAKYNNIVLLALDVDNDASLAAAVKVVESKVKYLDILVNNAGVMPADSHPLTVSRAVVQSTFNTNVASVVAATQVFLPLVKAAAAAGRNARVINVSSALGSTSFVPTMVANLPAGFINSPYFASKAAVNNITVQFAAAVPEVSFSSIHPGWVKTDLGSEHAPLEKEDAVNAIRALIESRNKSNSGQFVDAVSGGDILPF